MQHLCSSLFVYVNLNRTRYKRHFPKVRQRLKMAVKVFAGISSLVPENSMTSMEKDLISQ